MSNRRIDRADMGRSNAAPVHKGAQRRVPAKTGEGLARTLSPDGKWVVTQDLTGTALKLVPTGAGEGRTGKQLIATGAERGKSGRTYLVDAQTGDSKPLTPEGYRGTAFSHDGSKVAMRGPDGTWGIWTMADSKFTPIPSLDPKYGLRDWTRDDRELYAVSSRSEDRGARVFRVDPKTGKMEFWKEFGGNMTGIQSVGSPLMAQAADAYVYVYTQTLSEGYVVSHLQ